MPSTFAQIEIRTAEPFEELTVFTTDDAVAVDAVDAVDTVDEVEVPLLIALALNDAKVSPLVGALMAMTMPASQCFAWEQYIQIGFVSLTCLNISTTTTI